MPIFPSIEIEPILQSGDRTRINASKSFATKDVGAISKVEIDPGTGTFIDVTNATDATDLSTAYLDFAHTVTITGTKTIQVRVTCGTGPSATTATATATMQIITAADDHLFSSDADLVSAEPDILRFVKEGRNTFLDVHRSAQDEIVRYLDEKGYTDAQLNPLTKNAIVDVNEVRLWSKFMALRMIFEGLSNTSDDVFRSKADRYEEREQTHRNKALLRLDIDGDGKTYQDEGVYIQSGNLFRR